MQMRKSTLKKKLKRWRVDEAERYTEAVPDGRNNSKGSSYTRVARLCTKQHGVLAESAKRQQEKKKKGEGGELHALLRRITVFGNKKGP